MPEFDGALVLFTLLLPFLGFLALSTYCRLLPRNGDWVAIALLMACSLVSVWLFMQCYLSGEVLSGQWNWVLVGERPWGFAWRIDAYSSLMLFVITLVTLLVMIFSTSYMAGERNYGRYFSYLCLFSGAMMGLVIVDHLLLIYVFWELVGLASYLLIGFWQEKPQAPRASKKAFLINRIGDAGFLIGLLAAYQAFGTLEVSQMLEAIAEGKSILSEEPLFLIAGFGLALGGMAKSAQLPFSVWLPEAMVGPTSVSALLHAATMVAAGVYMLARVSPMLAIEVETMLLVVGSVTAFFGAFSALFQYDLKKVLAYSTISQLGYMFMGIGVGEGELAMFHLLTHAFFKACLFLGAGSVIHSLHRVAQQQKVHFDAQDMRTMGGLKRSMPWTYRFMLVSGLALAGLPLFSGFLSKDALLASVWRSGADQAWQYIPLVLGLVAALFTAFYIGRLLLLTFWGSWRNAEASLSMVEENDLSMTAPMAILGLGSLWIFFSLNPLDAGHGWFLSLNLPDMVHDRFNTITAVATTVLGTAGLGFAFWRYRLYSGELLEKANFLTRLSLNALFLDRLYLWLVKNIVLAISSLLAWFDKNIVDGIINAFGVLNVILAHLAEGFDRWVIDGFVKLIGYSIGGIGRFSTQVVQQGKVQGYIAAAFIALMLLLWWFVF